ncbi:MAG TPA: sigma-54-dependent Fis family transcriptional regulator [Myxococcota bacterium]|nr:sigma-54-dependent Fis family transcriptional regulator [Myxococcota bacterium]HRY94092.1 sigma-54-dependent Fis family transcriptional regulator [Myxococcota bacterium]
MGQDQPLLESDLRLLYDLLRDATRRSDLKGLFHVLFRGGREGLAAREGLIARHNPVTSSLEIKVKTPGRLQEREDLLLDDRPPVAALLTLAEPLVRREPEGFFFAGSGVQVAAPIPVDAGASGILVLEAEDPEVFRPERLAFLRALLDQTSNVIRTRSSVESSRREAAAWWEVGRRMVSPADLDVSELSTLLGQVLQLAMARTKTTNGIILMADEKSGELVTYTQAVMGDLMYQVPDKIRRRQRARASGIVFQVLDSNKPYLSSNIETDPNYIPLFKGIKSHLSVPISFQDRCIGVIVVESPEPNAFTLEDQKVLEELSKNIVTLVRRAQLYEATRDDSPGGGRGILIRGLSPEWKEVEHRVERAASTNATVILRGESGTGKELVAHAIHFNSKRRERKLVVVNSAAIPDQLLESTLFGHVRGAFTGASYDRVGEFEKADGGTIFLDEIGELSLPLQAKLLRVLQAGEIQKVGSNEDAKHVDVRVIAATSRDLEAMMKAGQFREDLYYRLHVVPIWLPALRLFKKSLPGMVKSFIEEAAREFDRQVTGITAEAMELLLRHDYPGNVRELRNIVEQAIIMARGELIGVEDLPAQLVAAVSSGGASPVSTNRDFKSRKKETLDRFEREYLHDLLSEVRGNISRASEISGINRVNFYKLLRRHEIESATYR